MHNMEYGTGNKVKTRGVIENVIIKGNEIMQNMEYRIWNVTIKGSIVMEITEQ